MAVLINAKELQFRYGDELIKFYRLSRESLNNKVLIKVHPNCRVDVLATANKTDSEVVEATKKRSRWIYKQLKQFRVANEYYSPRKFIFGESHFYLGKQYLLKVIENPEISESVKLLRGKLELTARDRDSKSHLYDVLNAWYRQRAKTLFNERLSAMLQQTLWVDYVPQITIRLMQKQWGSCSIHGRLTLNLQLIKTPIECIDYVILHELCHIAEHNHSEKFYRLLKQVMPNWEEVKVKLDGLAYKFF